MSSTENEVVERSGLPSAQVASFPLATKPVDESDLSNPTVDTAGHIISVNRPIVDTEELTEAVQSATIKDDHDDTHPDDTHPDDAPAHHEVVILDDTPASESSAHPITVDLTDATESVAVETAGPASAEVETVPTVDTVVTSSEEVIPVVDSVQSTSDEAVPVVGPSASTVAEQEE